MSLESYTASLPIDMQFTLAIRLTRLALPIWENFANKNELSYVDTVIGIRHSVDKSLLSKTIDAVESCLFTNSQVNISELSSQFDDPIVSLQDNDWELPEEVKKTFYSVFNLLEAVEGKTITTFNESTIYVSINQAVDAVETAKIMSVEEINKMLHQFKNSG